jgi:cbb3-type cytochrome c oxidase subunit II
MRKFLNTDGLHRALEGWPLVFTVLTTIAILIGGLVQFLPLVLVEDNIPRIESVQPWTPLELAGRDIYIKEGCNNCHSQAVRPFRHELERYGEYQKAGETIYERPFLWGSKRTGPDLLRIGGKYSHLWHLRHMEDPRSTSPNSIMPPYPWLLTKEARLDNLPAKLRALQRLGTPYTDEEVQNAEAIAREQAAHIAAELVEQGGPEGLESKEIIALIAYLQRLGTDISRQPESVSAASE